jgi:hypothetical protein
MKVTKNEIQFIKKHILTDISYGSGGTFHRLTKGGLDTAPSITDANKALKIIRKLELLIK